MSSTVRTKTTLPSPLIYVHGTARLHLGLPLPPLHRSQKISSGPNTLSFRIPFSQPELKMPTRGVTYTEVPLSDLHTDRMTVAFSFMASEQDGVAPNGDLANSPQASVRWSDLSRPNEAKSHSSRLLRSLFHQPDMQYQPLTSFGDDERDITDTDVPTESQTTVTRHHHHGHGGDECTDHRHHNHAHTHEGSSPAHHHSHHQHSHDHHDTSPHGGDPSRLSKRPTTMSNLRSCTGSLISRIATSAFNACPPPEDPCGEDERWFCCLWSAAEICCKPGDLSDQHTHDHTHTHDHDHDHDHSHRGSSSDHAHSHVALRDKLDPLDLECSEDDNHCCEESQYFLSTMAQRKQTCHG